MLSCLLLFLVIVISPFVCVQSENVPIITQTPKDYFPQYSQLEVTCQADGDPVPDISWYNTATKQKIVDSITIRGFRYTVRISRIGTQSRLVINDPGRREEYPVYCNASNSLGYAVSPSATVGKAYISSIFETDPPSLKEVYPGATVQLSCKPPKGRPLPKVTWLKNGLALDLLNTARHSATTQIDSDGSRISILKILNSVPDDAGLYQCLAENSFGSEKSTTSTLSFRTDLKVSKEFTFMIASNATISCPLPAINSFVWVRQDGQKLDLTRITVDKDSLTITNVQASDSGRYVCKSTLRTGNTVDALVNLIIQSPATFLLTPEDKSVLDGDDVTFKCIVSGYPLPEVYWEVPGLGALFPEDSTYFRFQVKKGGSLHISNVQLSDAGKYTCNCHSSLDVRHSSAYLTVKKRELANFPVISLPPQNQTLLEGSTATFRCEVVSHMEATITWYRGPHHEPLQAGDRISLPTRGALQIRKIDPVRDTNLYTCEASLKNDGMKTRWTAFLRVIYPDSGIQVVTPLNDESQLPLPPVLDSPVDKTSSSVTLSWSSSGQVKYWIEYVQFGSSTGWVIYKKDWSDVKITVKNLDSNSWYQFLVRARNTKGLSRASVPTEYVKTLGREDNRSTSKFDIKDRKVLSMFSQIQIINVGIHPIRFGKAKIEWQINVPESSIVNYIDGFKVRYTMMPLSRCLDDSNRHRLPKERYCTVQKHSDSDIRHWIVQADQLPGSDHYLNHTSGIVDVRLPVLDHNNVIKTLITGLSPFSCYDFVIDAYSDLPVSSPESSSSFSLMIEDIPSQPPHNIRTFWAKTPNILVIIWQLPPKNTWNGILTGFVVHIFANDSQTLLGSMQFNKTSLEVKIQNLDQSRQYSLHMSLTNCRGEGIRSERIHVTQKVTGSSAYEQQAWFIPVIVIGTLIFWVLLCCLVVYLCCVRFHLISGGPKFKSKDRNLEPLITISMKDPRFDKLPPKNKFDTQKTYGIEPLYSETSIINPNHMTTCSLTSSTCTPYASASIVDQNDNPNEMNTFPKYYPGSMMDDHGVTSGTILPSYLNYAPQYTAYSHTGPMIPFSINSTPLQNILTSTSINTGLNINSPLYTMKDDNHVGGGGPHSKFVTQSMTVNNWPTTVKMGISQLAGSSSGTSSSGSGCPKKPLESKSGTFSVLSPAPPSPSTIVSESIANDREKCDNESPKSTVHYDIIPNGESCDEFCEFSSQSSDSNNGEQYESGNDISGQIATSVPTGTGDDASSQQSPGYSTDSVTYSAVPHRPYPKSHRKKQMRHKHHHSNSSNKPKM